jgi:predicted Zn-dependent peptidase
LSLIVKEMQKIKEKSITEQEFARAKEQLKGNYILGLESSVSRMNAIANP